MTLDAIKARLVDDWKQAYKFWSVRLGGLGLTLQSILTAFPDAATQTWNALPADLKAVLPEHFANFIAIGLIAAGLIARLVKQKTPANG